MNEHLKLLLISLTVFLGLLIIVIFNARYECHDVRYQNLEGTHTKQVCAEK